MRQDSFITKIEQCSAATDPISQKRELELVQHHHRGHGTFLIISHAPKINETYQCHHNFF